MFASWPVSSVEVFASLSLCGSSRDSDGTPLPFCAPGKILNELFICWHIGEARIQKALLISFTEF